MTEEIILSIGAAILIASMGIGIATVIIIEAVKSLKNQGE